MGEVGQIALGEISGCARMLGVTAQTGGAVGQHAVERAGVGNISLNLGVTGEATLGHCALVPGGVMARAAVGAESSVRCHPAKGDTNMRLGAEGARAEHRAAAQQGDNNSDDDGDKARDHAKRCKAAKTTHDSPPSDEGIPRSSNQHIVGDKFTNYALVAMLPTISVATHTVAEIAYPAVFRHHIALRVALVAGVGLELLRSHIRVACDAWNLPATAMVEREDMFEDHILPTARYVTGGAVGAKLPKVNLRVGVTAHACGGRTLIDVVGVALHASCLDVGTRERERGLAMVECRNLFPVVGRMAGGAVGAVLAHMNLRLRVAVHTCSGCTFIDVVAVAVHACRLNMGTGEREGGLVMVERNLIPAAGRVAGHTIRAEGTLVYVVLLVAGHACTVGDFEIGLGAGRRMAELTAHLDVLTFERKAHLGVVKVAIAIYTVVARQTIIAEIGAVRGHKGGLIIHMAADTTRRVEGVDI